jgi:uncharacterized protein YjbJ (UPF0337 family)
MDWNRIEGNWKQYMADAQQQWGKLSYEQLDVTSGKLDELAGKIQEAYGISRGEAQKQLAAWQGALKK